MAPGTNMVAGRRLRATGWRPAMLDESALLTALRRHWDHAGRDEDVAHKIYHRDAVLEFPQSGERFEGVHNFREWRRQYPAVLRFHTRRALGVQREHPRVQGRPRVPRADLHHGRLGTGRVACAL